MEFKHTGMLKCPRCGAENPVGSSTCTQCERILVPSGPIKFRANYATLMASWALVISTAAVFLYYFLNEPTKEKVWIREWIWLSRWPFDVLVDQLGVSTWKEYWFFGSVLVWTAIGGAVGGVLNLFRRR